jgi:hypothetical protein
MVPRGFGIRSIWQKLRPDFQGVMIVEKSPLHLRPGALPQRWCKYDNVRETLFTLVIVELAYNSA